MKKMKKSTIFFLSWKKKLLLILIIQKSRTSAISDTKVENREFFFQLKYPHRTLDTSQHPFLPQKIVCPERSIVLKRLKK